MECSALCCNALPNSSMNVGRRHAAFVRRQPYLGSSCRKFQIRAPAKPLLQVSWATSEAADAAEQWPVEGYKAKTFDAEVSTRFFNREYEVQYAMNYLLNDNSSDITVLLGPLNCGKTVGYCVAMLNMILPRQQFLFFYLLSHCARLPHCACSPSSSQCRRLSTNSRSWTHLVLSCMCTVAL